MSALFSPLLAWYPKIKVRKQRLIFHLSYPHDGDSVNSGIPKEECSVRYPDFEQAIRLCVKEGVSCSLSKSDMSSTFRHVPLRGDQWFLLVMMAVHPISGEVFYFVDKCLPFGSSISCAIFQEFSNAIAFLVQHRSRKPNVNYLDDFLFVATLRVECDRQMHIFLEVCKAVDFLVALEETFWSYGFPRTVTGFITSVGMHTTRKNSKGIGYDRILK